jgi:CarD family transcriptional regulator
VQLEIGDQVFHPIHGVGKVVAVKAMALNGERSRWYYEVVLINSTIWVLVEPFGIGRLRRITPKDELARYRALLKSEPASLSNNFRLRQVDLNDRMKLGTFQAICEVVRDLNARRLSKSLTDYESNLLKKAHEMLIQEWAATSKMTSREAAQTIDDLLLEGQKGAPVA